MLRTQVGRGVTAVIILGIAVLAGGVLSAAAAIPTDDGGIGITVTIAPTDGGGSGNDGPGPGGGPSTPPIVPTPAPSGTPKPHPGDFDLGGIVYVSGLTSHYIWSPNPTQSTAVLRFTVRNVSKTTFDSTARFWIDTTFGSRVSEVRGVAIMALRPGESRVVSATLGGLGQWTVLHGHVTFTPPPSVEGVTLAPITRDTFLFIPPLVAGGIGVVGGLVGVTAFLIVKFGWLARLLGLAKAFV
jgi:hypothetical protein